MATGLAKALAHLRQVEPGPTDGQLLARFVAARDEAAFACLVRRHGPMVLGVCRRVLRDFHEAEDAFQATFLVLARKAATVVKRESVGCWLYGTAYRTAMEARTMSARRRAREKTVTGAPHPAVLPPEAQDWRPLLDRELSLLPQKYRAALVLCDLEGRPRREAARLLGASEGTLSSRLARGRALLAKRLTRCGVALSAGALAAALAEGAASARVSAGLVTHTAKAAALVAAGQVAASTPAILLMKEVMKAMLLKKLRLVVGAGMLVLALGALGAAYQAGAGPGTAQAAEPGTPRTELEALRRENELLKLNLEVVLEKVRAQEAELREFRAQRGEGGTRVGAGGAMPGMGTGGTGSAGTSPPGGDYSPGGYGPGMPGMPGGPRMSGPPGMPGGGGGMTPPGGMMSPMGGGSRGGMRPSGGGGGMAPGTGAGAPGDRPGEARPGAGSGMAPGMGPGGGFLGDLPGGGKPMGNPGGLGRARSAAGSPGPGTDPLQQAESALKALREAQDPDAQRQATDRLEKALERLKQQHRTPQ
jgi:RNA polymerase sigma factor (sigma-70 family)